MSPAGTRGSGSPAVSPHGWVGNRSRMALTPFLKRDLLAGLFGDGGGVPKLSLSSSSSLLRSDSEPVVEALRVEQRSRPMSRDGTSNLPRLLRARSQVDRGEATRLPMMNAAPRLQCQAWAEERRREWGAHSVPFDA
mmetsp:Transcript_174324/g.558829  ORF Transcript_174324/g.558829 Transcript_174324/m.558829 type:complete len:137 (+) Transcript_174324:1005-1415(+)